MNCHPAHWADILIKNVHACFITRLVFLHGSDWNCWREPEAMASVTEHAVGPRMECDFQNDTWDHQMTWHFQASKSTEIEHGGLQNRPEYTCNDKNKQDMNHHKQ